MTAVGQERISQIKKTDSNPLFVAYTVIQEGMSKPKVLGEGGKSIFWPKEVVNKALSVLKKGLQFFKGHGDNTNSHTGRKPVGEIVGNISKNIKGKLSQIVIGYFPNKEDVKEADICSIESDILVKEIDKTTDIASSIKNISGIALENSRVENPAFEGAVRLASLQCFVDESNQDKNKNVPGRVNMTYEDFLNARFEWFARAIKDKSVFPNQLFTEDDLRNDRNFSTLFAGKADLEKQIATLTEENNTFKTKVGELESKSLQSDAKDRFTGLLPAGLTDRQKKFIVAKFKPSEITDLTDEGLKQFITKSQDDFKTVAQIFNLEEENTGQTGNENNTDNNNISKDATEEVLEDIMS